MEFVYLIAAIVSVATVICILIMGQNVGDIARHLMRGTSPDFRDAKANYYKCLSLNDTEKAHEYLLYMLYYQVTDPKNNDKKREKRFKELEAVYGKDFEMLGYKFPDNPF